MVLKLNLKMCIIIYNNNIICSIQRLQHVASSVSYFMRPIQHTLHNHIYTVIICIKCRPDMTSAPH